MGRLGHSDIAACKALHRIGTVKAINAIPRTMDVQIGDIVYEDVDVHYHCQSQWEEGSHPHSNDERSKMLSAFDVDDRVLMLCNDDARPLYVVGFVGNQKRCTSVIVVKNDEGDIWYWDIVNNQGYHLDPGAVTPTEPEIVTTWWSCDGADEQLFYTRATPVLSIIGTGGCGDDCGLINFDDECCDAAEEEDDENISWDNCPCGGEWEYDVVYGWNCIEEYNCQGGDCGEFTGKSFHGGCQSTYNDTNRESTNCDEGYSWEVSVSGLSERMDIGPRSIMQGTRGSSVCTVDDSICGPYECTKMYCPNLKEETCVCDLSHGSYSWGGQGCCGTPACSNWYFDGDYRYVTSRLSSSTNVFGGCIDITEKEKSSTFSEKTVPLETVITVGEKETSFPGSWSEDKSNDGSITETQRRVGWGNSCQGSCAKGVLDTDTYDEILYTYTELSYGIAGWSVVALSDGKFAVLVPKLSLSALAESKDGAVTGNITSTTTVILRVVDDTETDFEIVDGNTNATLLSVPNNREDLGIKPECTGAINAPIEITLRGFHWQEVFGQIFTAFDFGGEFAASLIYKEEGVWMQNELDDFKDWIEANGLEEYTMFLG